ncbi:MAG: putative glycoside hydrolase [Candidatus Magasanikbacteria bacterium]|nr:putative glycoside hydrolase [Candidatus Magasanikbacteria bacterium]
MAAAFSRQSKKFLSLILMVVVFLSLLPQNGPVKAQSANEYPRLASLYLYSPIRQSDVPLLARWDVLILHMLAQQNSAEQIRQIRQINPEIKILVYITSQEFPINKHAEWDRSPNGLFKRLLSGISDDMWLRDGGGAHVVFWDTAWMLNVTDYQTNGRRWNDYLSDFVVNELLSSGLWDGVFYDNTWANISWLNGGAIDSNRDGQNDRAADLDSAWQSGMSKLFKLTREKYKQPLIIVGNGDKGYYGDINGIYFENFSTNGYISWEEKMRLYGLSANTSREPKVAILGNTSADPTKAQTDYTKVRFGLASSLMENGYFSYDAGSQSHSEKWWYDEYNVNLGAPMGVATPMNGGSGYYKDVWRREFTNGLAVVNSLAEEKEVDLGGEFEKLIGTQDPKVNNGGIVSKIKVAAKDGLLMLKTYQTVKDLVFVNGAFVRFVDYLGQRVRNGFFAYDARYPGGARILFSDIDNAGDEETIVASGSKLEIFNSQGEHWFSDYPFGGNFKGDIRISVNKLFEKQAENQIVISPSFGNNIMMYNYHGAVMQGGYTPFDPKKYVGGFSVAAAQLDGPGKPGSVVVGVGKGKPAEVLIYDNRISILKKRFYPYDKTFKGGIYVATGDITGDGRDEIIVSAMSVKKMPIRVFDGTGKKLSEFIPSGLLGSAGAMVGTVDVNFDGKMDIAVINL